MSYLDDGTKAGTDLGRLDSLLSTTGENHRGTLSTGIAGLDNILGGGLPRERLYLIAGDPGSGKTTLALQFLLEGRDRGEKGIYVTLSETREELDDVAHSHGWSLDGLTLIDTEVAPDAVQTDSHYTVFHPSEVELQRTVDSILAEVEAVFIVELARAPADATDRRAVR
jgi:circadian clock protein KaiC